MIGRRTAKGVFMLGAKEKLLVFSGCSSVNCVALKIKVYGGG